MGAMRKDLMRCPASVGRRAASSRCCAHCKSCSSCEPSSASNSGLPSHPLLKV